MKNKLLSICFVSLIISQTTFAEFTLPEATIASVHQAIETHQLTCVELVNLYLDRIKKYNLSVSHNMPPFNAIAEINPQVIDEAKKLDESYARTNQLVGPLHCIPVLLKDNIDSFDGTSTSGSLVLLGNHPTQDAFLVDNLRKSGAIILGKGSMDEFASGIAGISGCNGRTGNAYNRNQNSGGSSSGPGVAVSANFVMVAVGTDNSGSVRFPAAFNGIIGLRPSTGLVSQTGIFPRGNMDGIAGPLARNAEDLAILLDVIAKPDPKDKKTLSITRPNTYTIYLKANGITGKRIGVIRSIGKINPYKNMPEDAKTAINDSLHAMKSRGAIIVDNIKLPDFNMERKYNEAGELQDVNAYLSSAHLSVKTYRNICLSNKTRTFGTSSNCLKFINHIPSRESKEYKMALNIFAQNKHYLESIMEKNHLDALFIPVNPHGSATYDPKSFGNEVVASNSGLPGITMTAGYTKKASMPISVEFIAKQYNEGTLIEIVYSYEKHTQPRQVPMMPEPDSLNHLTITEYNDLLTAIGETSYADVLRYSHHGNFYSDLTPIVFRKIVVTVLTKKQLDTQIK